MSGNRNTADENTIVISDNQAGTLIADIQQQRTLIILDLRGFRRIVKRNGRNINRENILAGIGNDICKFGYIFGFNGNKKSFKKC